MFGMCMYALMCTDSKSILATFVNYLVLCLVIEMAMCYSASIFISIMSCERVADFGKPLTYEPRFEVQYDF